MSDEMDTFGMDDMDFADTPEIGPVEPGTYTARIASFELKMSKGDPSKGKLPAPYFQARLDLVDEPTAQTIFHYVGNVVTPAFQQDNPRGAALAASNIKKFLRTFNLPMQIRSSDFTEARDVQNPKQEWTTAVGAEAQVNVGKRNNDRTGEAENFLIL